MASTIFIVTRERFTSQSESHLICGVYDNFRDAVERVNEVFHEDEYNFIEYYDGMFVAENHNNGYAELQYGLEDYDNITIKATELDINESTYYEI